MATAHAKSRPPSAAKRWLPCPFSATVAPLYDRGDTKASLKGDYEHDLMETLITFGTLPKDCNPDAADALQVLYEYVVKRFKEAGPSARIYIEVQLDIPETGEFGTADIVIVCDDWIEIIDYKSGYVVVKIKKNEQMMTYLSGAVARWGVRRSYKLTVHQPNYDHIDGVLRHDDVDTLDLVEFQGRIEWSMTHPNHVEAGPWCKETYCEHRGACEAFRAYCFDDLSPGWHTSELKAMSDDDLSKALDASDELAGWRTELRNEAMRRILNMGRAINGYKMVKGRRNRTIRFPQELVVSVRDTLGVDWALKLFDPELTWASEVIRKEITFGPVPSLNVLKYLGSAKHIEDVLKQYARVHDLPRGGWKMLYDNVVGEYIRETAEGLTLERAIDGRPAHKRGSEFGVIDPAKVTTATIL